MNDKVIDKEDYNKVMDNLMDNLTTDKFQGCLFIYDDNYKKEYETIEMARVRVNKVKELKKSGWKIK